jgi:hypothetical protein
MALDQETAILEDLRGNQLNIEIKLKEFTNP